MPKATLKTEDLPLVITVDHLMHYLGISRPSIRIGKAIRIPKDSLLRWMDRKAGIKREE